MRDPKEHLSLREASDALGISEVSARRWVKSGKLKAYQPGRKYLVPVSAVEELLEITKPPKAPAPLQLELEKQRGANEVSVKDLSDLCGEIYTELQGVREAPAEDLKTQAIADLDAALKEAQAALSAAIYRTGPPRLSELSMQRVTRQRRVRQSDEGAASETA
jgi:excisionase family DNA binding protein